MRSLRMLKTPNDSLWRSFFIILLPNQSTLRSAPFAGKQRTQILFSGSKPVVCLFCHCRTEPCRVGHSQGLKGTKLDHRDTRRQYYSQYKWLSAGLIDKLPLHFISQTDRA